MKLGLVLVINGLLFAQQAQHRMEIKLELHQESSWKTVDPATIFDQGAQVRFRVQANFSGWVYVMNQGTGGTYTLLFPREDTGQNNRMEPGREFIVPASGAFRVAGPAGHDVVYWMVTPVEMASGGQAPASSYVPLPPPPPPGTKMNTLMPRCDDSVFRARGDCIDPKAGPRKVANLDELPSNLKDVQGLNSRELLFIKEKDSAVVSSPGDLKGPVIYEFRLSHK